VNASFVKFTAVAGKQYNWRCGKAALQRQAKAKQRTIVAFPPILRQQDLPVTQSVNSAEFRQSQGAGTIRWDPQLAPHRPGQEDATLKQSILSLRIRLQRSIALCCSIKRFR
jgi:hypothetical protein